MCHIRVAQGSVAFLGGGEEKLQKPGLPALIEETISLPGLALLQSKSYLEQLYTGRHLSTRQIAELTDMSRSVVLAVLGRSGTRTPERQRPHASGTALFRLCPAWPGSSLDATMAAEILTSQVPGRILMVWRADLETRVSHAGVAESCFALRLSCASYRLFELTADCTRSNELGQKPVILLFVADSASNDRRMNLQRVREIYHGHRGGLMPDSTRFPD